MKKTAPTRRDRIRTMLADLEMPGALEELDPILQQVDSAQLTAGEAIETLLSAQISLRNNRRLQAAIRSSRLPAVKTLGDFDFNLHLDRQVARLNPAAPFDELRERIEDIGQCDRCHLVAKRYVEASPSMVEHLEAERDRGVRKAGSKHEPPRGSFGRPVHARASPPIRKGNPLPGQCLRRRGTA